MLKSFFLLQMLSQTLVDEVFMHHFEKMSSASGVFAPRLHRGAAPGAAGGLPSFRPFIAPTPSPGKNPAGAHVSLVLHFFLCKHRLYFIVKRGFCCTPI